MKYIIMCGGEYSKFKTPRQLTIIKGERIVERTIRLLKENGIEDIAISSNSPLFDNLGVSRIEHFNNFKVEKIGNKEIITGDWLDAYYPTQEPVCYLYGDVYYSEEAIKTIINNKDKGNILFGTSIAKNELHENWGEPFAYKVNDPISFFKGIDEVKKLKNQGKINREPITWELYRYLHGLDINIQQITTDYVCIDDITMDLDNPEDINLF